MLVCAHGYSSSLAAATLRDLGYERATDVIGGFAAWADAGLPVKPNLDAPIGATLQQAVGVDSDIAVK